ncbi:hypothetical protein ACL7TT_07800 [Microbulbifer sp. 2304DJ12-6]|uniref:hypothetical protein n=1 Tax=Microbulbifer sp. 2304DJ12-6 TaxID=3233340 RepID=UPI00261624F6|nr:hypothetical protein [uncultured Microbulbifer sp.]
MSENALDSGIAGLCKSWTGLNSDTIIQCRAVLARLAASSRSESWLAELHERKAPTAELYRDPERGFILLAHVETQGLYRNPHNHGDGWVFYALQHGAVEMSTYGQFKEQVNGEGLVSRGAYTMKAGDCSAFLPGDIHDTLCLSEYSLMFRLTSCDFSVEKRAGRLQQFKPVTRAHV